MNSEKRETVYMLYMSGNTKWVAHGKPKTQSSKKGKQFLDSLTPDELRVFNMRGTFKDYFKKKREFYKAIEATGQFPYQLHFAKKIAKTLTAEELAVKKILCSPLDPPAYVESNDPPPSYEETRQVKA